METSVKAKIALALMIIGIAILAFNYFGTYFITRYLHPHEYFIITLIEGRIAETCMALSFLLFSTLLIKDDRIRRITVIVLVVAVTLVIVGGSGLVLVSYALLNHEIETPQWLNDIWFYAFTLGALLTSLGLTLLLYQMFRERKLSLVS